MAPHKLQGSVVSTLGLYGHGDIEYLVIRYVDSTLTSALRNE